MKTNRENKDRYFIARDADGSILIAVREPNDAKGELTLEYMVDEYGFCSGDGASISQDDSFVEISRNRVTTLFRHHKTLCDELKQLSEGKVLSINRELQEGDCITDGSCYCEIVKGADGAILYKAVIFHQYQICIAGDPSPVDELFVGLDADCQFIPRAVYEEAKQRVADAIESIMGKLNEICDKEKS